MIVLLSAPLHKFHMRTTSDAWKKPEQETFAEIHS